MVCIKVSFDRRKIYPYQVHSNLSLPLYSLLIICKKRRLISRVSNSLLKSLSSYGKSATIASLQKDLRRLSLNENSCPFCTTHKETIEHLFLQCHFEQDIWMIPLISPSIPPPSPTGSSNGSNQTMWFHRTPRDLYPSRS